jgi:large subunit ribosomal protein L7A
MNNEDFQSFVVGTKQTLKAVKKNIVKTCYIAKDADVRNVEEIIKFCTENNVNIIYVDTMKDLGDKFKIKVGAACAAILN